MSVRTSSIRHARPMDSQRAKLQILTVSKEFLHKMKKQTVCFLRLRPKFGRAVKCGRRISCMLSVRGHLPPYIKLTVRNWESRQGERHTENRTCVHVTHTHIQRFSTYGSVSKDKFAFVYMRKICQPYLSVFVLGKFIPDLKHVFDIKLLKFL